MAVTLRSRVRGCGERAGSLVEYALVLAVVLALISGGIDALTSASASELDDQASAINREGPAKSYVTAPTSVPPTTAAPSVTTSTTAPPTPTTQPPAGPTPTSLQIGRAEPAIVWWNGRSGAWKPVVRFEYGWSHGANITVQVTRHLGDGDSQHAESSVWINGNAATSIDWLGSNDISDDASRNVVAVDVTVVRIETQGAASGTYSVSEPTAHVDAPIP